MIGSIEISAGASSDKYLLVTASEGSNDFDGASARVKADFTDGTSATVDLRVKSAKPDIGEGFEGTAKVDCYEAPAASYKDDSKLD